MSLALRSYEYYDFMAESQPADVETWSSAVGSFFVTENVDPSVASPASVSMYTEATSHDESTNIGSEDMTKQLNISVEGWQLAIAALTILAGSYYFAWDSHKSLLTELSGMRADMRDDRKSADDDLKKLIAEMKADRESDRQQAKSDNEAIVEQLTKLRETQSATTEALKSLK